MFREFAATTASRAPLYATMSAGIAADAELSGLLLTAPATQRQPVLLFACIHDLLLADPDDPLAHHYPNLAGPAADRGDPVPALRAFCRRRRRDLDRLLRTRRTQTNEIGRSALLLPAFGLLAEEVGPLAHLDVGASAGLNLLLDRYRYDYDPGGMVGGPSTVTIVCGTRGEPPIPAHLPAVAARRGIDPSPIDVRDEGAARWLEACTWPDQTDRFDRLRAALAMAKDASLDLRVGDAVGDTRRHVLELSRHGHPVVTNTWVLNYLTAVDRRAYVEGLDELGRHLDLSWVYVESPALTAELPGHPTNGESPHRTVVVLVRWRSGRRSAAYLADAHPHGYWLHWQR